MPSLSWLLTAPKQHLFGLGSSDNGLLSAPVCLLPPSKELELREQAAPQGESIWQGQLVELRSVVRSLPVRESGTMSLETGGALLCNKSSLSSYTKSRRHRAARVPPLSSTRWASTPELGMFSPRGCHPPPCCQGDHCPVPPSVVIVFGTFHLLVHSGLHKDKAYACLVRFPPSALCTSP